MRCRADQYPGKRRRAANRIRCSVVGNPLRRSGVRTAVIDGVPVELMQVARGWIAAVDGASLQDPAGGVAFFYRKRDAASAATAAAKAIAASRE